MLTFLALFIIIEEILLGFILVYGPPDALRDALNYFPEGMVRRLTIGERIAVFWLALPMTIYYATGQYASGWDFLTKETPVLLFKGRRVWPSDLR